MASDPTEGAYSAPQIQLLDLGGEGWVKEERGDRKKGKGKRWGRREETGEGGLERKWRVCLCPLANNPLGAHGPQ